MALEVHLMISKRRGISKLKLMHSHFSTWDIMTCRSNSWLKNFHKGVCLQQGTVLGSGDSLFARGLNHPTACSVCCLHTWSTPPLVILKTIPIIEDLTGKLTRYAVSSELEGELLSLPVRLVGIGLANQATSSPHSYFLYLQINYYCLSALIATEETYLTVDLGEVENKKETR